MYSSWVKRQIAYAGGVEVDLPGEWRYNRPTMTLDTTDRGWAAGLSLAALLLTLHTLAPTVVTVFDDSLEFQLIGPSLGIAHPTGYPLYTLLAWLFSLIPLGDPAFRVNLLSAVAGAATVGLLYIVARKLESSRLAASLAAVILALSPTWWSQATIAEVYTLHGFFVALILLLALDGEAKKRWLALAFAAGLALTHHRMTLLLGPGLVVFILWNDPRLLRQPRRIFTLLAALLAPLLLYLYLPLRGLSISSLDGAYSNTWSGFWRHILASDYNAFLTGNPLAVERPRNYALTLLIEQMGLAALIFGLLGWLNWRKQPRRWTLLALLLLPTLLFAAGYRAADVDVFYLPATMIWLLLAAAGLTLTLDRATRWLGSGKRQLQQQKQNLAWLTGLQIGLAALLLFQPLQQAGRILRATPPIRTCAEVLAVGLPPAFSPNRAGDWSASNCGRAILNLPLPQDAVIIGLLGETTLLRYFQMAGGLRPDLSLVTADAEDRRLAAVGEAIAAGRAVYLTRPLAGLAEQYSLDALGPLIRVSPVESTDNAGATRAHSVFTPGCCANGSPLRYVLTQVEARGAVWLRLSLSWQVEAASDEELKVSARLLGPDGSVVASQDAVPVHWAYPTTVWRPGEIVDDVYEFALPADTDPAGLSPLIILYRAADGSEVGRWP